MMMAMRAAVWQNCGFHSLDSVLHAVWRSGIKRGGRSLKRRQVIRDMVMIAARGSGGKRSRHAREYMGGEGRYRHL